MFNRIFFRINNLIQFYDHRKLKAYLFLLLKKDSKMKRKKVNLNENQKRNNFPFRKKDFRKKKRKKSFILNKLRSFTQNLLFIKCNEGVKFFLFSVLFSYFFFATKWKNWKKCQQSPSSN